MQQQLTKKILTIGYVFLIFIFSVFHTISIFGLHGYECVGLPEQGSPYCLPINLRSEFLLAFVIGILSLYFIRKHLNPQNNIALWKKNWFLLLFLILICTSTIWSAAPFQTITKAFFLLLLTFAITLILSTYSMEQVVICLGNVGIAFILINILYVLIKPAQGIMQNWPYEGSWQGIFWHRNFLGSVIAFFSTVYIFSLLLAPSKDYVRIVRNFILWFISWYLLVQCHSAAGIITAFACNVFVVILFIWNKLRKKLRKIHYLFFVIILFIFLVVLLMNINFVFGLLNRDTSLTGRLPMWSYLLTHVVTQRPIFGYGFGAIWSFTDFRIQVQEAVDWGYPVLIGDNGWIDILLHLGLVGFGCMVILQIVGLGKSIRQMVSTNGLIACFPLITVSYIILANISLSMFLETESFTWALFLIPYFCTSVQETE
jgi:exopolysaccharide production protein ExoQ